MLYVDKPSKVKKECFQLNSAKKLLYTRLRNNHAIIRQGTGYPGKQPHKGVNSLG